MLLNEMFDVMKKLEKTIAEKDLEIERLNKRMKLMEQYIDIYEEFINGCDRDGNRN